MWHLEGFLIRTTASTEARPLPGVWVGEGGRRAARGRRGDVLLVFVTQHGPAPLPQEALRPLLAQMGARYFQTTGTVTRAMRQVAEALNRYLLARNRRLAGEGAFAVAHLALAVWRENRLYLGLSGPLHAYLLGTTWQHWHDPVLMGRGVGMGQGVRMYFARQEVRAGEVLVLAENPPPHWNAQTLRLDAGQRLEPLLRRAVALTTEDVEALMVQGHPGAGEHRLRLWQPRTSLDPTAPESSVTEPQEKVLQPTPAETALETPPAQATSAAEQVAPSPTEVRERPHIPVPEEEVEAGKEPTLSAAKEVGLERVEAAPEREQRTPRRVVRRPPSHLVQARTGMQEEREESHTPRAPQAALRRPKSRLGGNWLRRAGAGMAQVFARVGGGVRRLGAAVASNWQRLFPAEEWVALPRSAMAFVALAVPLVVVSMALAVYLRRGRAQQFAQYFAQAQVYAQTAFASEDPVARHNALEQALYALSLAEMYGHSAEEERLYQQVQQALDEMDGVVRLAFQPVVQGHPLRGRRVVRLAFRPGEMYVLDGAQGRVLRLREEPGGYVLDADFRCGPDSFPGFEMGPLVDFVAVEPTEMAYAVVGVDAQGHLLFCAPGEDPVARPLPLEGGLPAQGRVMRYFSPRLYLLHPAARAIEVLTGDQFAEPPYNFFTADAPSDLELVVDFAVQRGEVYLLYGDGQMLRCAQPVGEEAPACEALTYQDERPGRVPGPTVPEARWLQMELSGPPDPSVFFLDQHSGGVYRFSLQLRFVEQYRPAEAWPGEPTAFAVQTVGASGQRLLYVAAGEQIYGAVLP